MSVLNRADKLSEYGVPQSRAHAKQQLDADVKKNKKENVIYELAKINGYKNVFGDDKEKSTKVPHSGYKLGKGEFEYTSGVMLAVTGRKRLSGLVFVTTFRRNF